jgi:hypothetical protein
LRRLESADNPIIGFNGLANIFNNSSFYFYIFSVFSC